MTWLGVLLEREGIVLRLPPRPEIQQHVQFGSFGVRAKRFLGTSPKLRWPFARLFFL
jgi:hypothetical protein